VEWKPLGVHVTILPPGPTDTPVIEKFGFNRENMPIKPMKWSNASAKASMRCENANDRSAMAMISPHIKHRCAFEHKIA
jgi:hypothetical protein